MTDLQDLRELIKAGESDTCEWKKSTAQLMPAAKTLCAFLNGEGGTVLFGVAPEGAIVGQAVSDKTRLKIAASLKEIEPQATIEIEEIPVEGNLKVIALQAKPDANLRPYLYDGRAYQRRGPSTSRMPTEVLYRQVQKRPENETLWEGRAATGFTLDHLDVDEAIRMVKHGIGTTKVPHDINLGLEDILQGLDLLTEEGLVRNAAVVLFGKSAPLSKRLLQCSLKLACYRGTDKAEFLDESIVEGGAFHMLKEAELFIRRHMPVAAKIVPEQFGRVETPLIPWDAVREILVNALVHRDYSDPGGSLEIAIYDDRMEVWNTGELPSGIRLDQLKTKHKSVLRNRRIADVFYKYGMIETWGRGTQRVVDLCKKAGLDEPEFMEDQQSFGVISQAPFVSIPILAEEPELNPLQKQILELLSASEKTPIRTLVAETGAPNRTVLRAVSGLVNVGLIQAEGKGRASGYRKRQGD